MMWRFLAKVCFTCILLIQFRCSRNTTEQKDTELTSQIRDSTVESSQESNLSKPIYSVVKRPVLMKDYFRYIDSVANNNLHSSILNEYILVDANPWIVDSLRSKDYYHQKKKGVFVYDQSKQTIFHSGDSLLIPDMATAAASIGRLKLNRIVLNIPEYILRVIEGTDTVLTCPVRVGQNAEAYLEYYQRIVNLRTPIGEGEIVNVRKKPKYIDLATGEEYEETNRDDGRRTKMPIMPSLEPNINGMLVGTLIHATTNPKSLGKAYSHGCVGTSEPDIWSIFYRCPPGTKVSFRYDLEIKGPGGKPIQLKDVYHRIAK